jgi:hypothetical protein
MSDKKYINLRVPIKIKNKLKRNHFEKKGWTKIYYYVNRIRHELDKKVVMHDVVMGDCYRHDTLYKDSALSKSNRLWDYYKILKPEYREPIIAQETTTQRKNDINMIDSENTTPIKKDYGFQKINGKFKITFD